MITTVWEIQHPDNELLWDPSESHWAAYCMSWGLRVRLVSAVDAAMHHAHREIRTEPWVVRQRVRKASGSRARALVCLCLRELGWSERAIGEALEVTASSVHELMDTYRGDKEVRPALKAWPFRRSETSQHNFCTGGAA